MYLSGLLLPLCAWSTLASPVDKSFELEVFREANHTNGSVTTDLPASLGHSLYWFANFDVGDSKNVKLLVDTGSTDLLVNPGIYKPSKHMTQFKGVQTFFAEYEGVNRAGFGNEVINGTIVRDIVSSGGLAIPNQAFGNITSFSYSDTRPQNRAVRGEGVVGFAGRKMSSFKPQQAPWFFNLCQNKLISSCRFGLAFGTSGKGLAVIGTLAKRLIDGPLVPVPMVDDQYFVRADVTLNNKVVAADQLIYMDVGTNNIQGPIGVTKNIFKKLGYPSVLKKGQNLRDPQIPFEVLTGYFPCNKPPTLGFAFPPKKALKKGENSTIFNVSPKVWDVYDNGNNNCTSILGGSNLFTNKTLHFEAWLLGQPFFAGHYLDFDATAKTISYGNLVDPSAPK